MIAILSSILYERRAFAAEILMRATLYLLPPGPERTSFAKALLAYLIDTEQETEE